MALALSVAAFAAAPCAQADIFSNVTYTASGDRSEENATIGSKSDPNAPSGTSSTNVNGLQFDLANYSGTLTLEGSGGDIVNTYDNGGFGGRFGLTNATANSHNLTVKISGGTEVSMGTVLQNSSTAPRIEADNASFYTGSGTIAANITVGTGGLRLNGSSGTTYTFTGKITGSGDITTTLGGSGVTKFTGDVSAFTGTWLNKPTANPIRTYQFGDGTADCTEGSVGGDFGSAEKRLQVEFNYTGDYSIAGTVYASTLTIASGNASFSNTVNATTLAINSTAAFSGEVTATTLNINNAATFSGTVSANRITVAGGGSFSLSDSGVYALNGKTVTALTVGGSGTISISGTNTFNGTLTANGSRISIAEEGVSFTTGALASLTKDATNETFVDSVSKAAGNGYSLSLRYVLIADNTVDTDQTFGSSTTGALAGTAIKQVVGTGLVAETTGTYGAYYINSGKVAYGGDDNAAASNATTKLILADGATVEINKELTVNLTTYGGTIQVNKDDNNAKNGSLAASQVTATAATTLTGNGNYKVTANSLGSNIRLATGETGWKGTVTLSNYTPGSDSQRNLSSLVNGTYSTLELIGYNGWTNPWNGSLDINFKLTDVGNTVAWANGAFSQTSTHTLTFNGKISGNGTFKVQGSPNAARYMNYTFANDISEWEGRFIKSGNNNISTTLTFNGLATDVHIVISRDKGTLNVVAGVDGVTFHKDIINATSLQVHNATLEGTATVDTLTLNAGATAELSGNGKVSLGTSAAPGRLSFEVLKPGTAEAAPAVATLQEGGAAETPAAATGSIHNGGGAAVSFSSTEAGSAATTYRNLNIKANSTAAFELQGTLDNSAVENNNVGTITVSAPGEGGSIAGLYANKGSIIVTTTQPQEAVLVGVLSVTQGTSVSVTGADSSGVGTIQTGDVRTVLNADAASATASLTANLVVADGASLTLPTVLDLGGNALTFAGNIGSLTTNKLRTLLFSNASTVTFGADTYAVADGQITLNSALAADQESGALLLSGDILDLDGGILLEVDGTSGRLNVTYSVPEPGTATLSLLALAGLCARRRRK